MKTRETIRRIRPDAETEKVIIKLERTIKNLCILRNNLNSYTCEPKIRSLFEMKHSLTKDINQMTQQNAAVLYDMRIANHPLENPVHYLQNQQKKVEALESKVLEYIGRAKFKA